mmetsp:Transcript_86480/g.197302  ORF Transcript_86480/g.197302 Transcript_86480/m.197302 type:complete len:388 (+) Transcript_86480:2336-3499(+)
MAERRQEAAEQRAQGAEARAAEAVQHGEARVHREWGEKMGGIQALLGQEREARFAADARVVQVSQALEVEQEKCRAAVQQVGDMARLIGALEKEVASLRSQAPAATDVVMGDAADTPGGCTSDGCGPAFPGRRVTPPGTSRSSQCASPEDSPRRRARRRDECHPAFWDAEEQADDDDDSAIWHQAEDEEQPDDDSVMWPQAEAGWTEAIFSDDEDDLTSPTSISGQLFKDAEAGGAYHFGNPTSDSTREAGVGGSYPTSAPQGAGVGGFCAFACHTDDAPLFHAASGPRPFGPARDHGAWNGGGAFGPVHASGPFGPLGAGAFGPAPGAEAGRMPARVPFGEANLNSPQAVGKKGFVWAAGAPAGVQSQAAPQPPVWGAAPAGQFRF